MAEDSTLPEVQAWDQAQPVFDVCGEVIGEFSLLPLLNSGQRLKKLATRQAQEIARLTQENAQHVANAELYRKLLRRYLIWLSARS